MSIFEYNEEEEMRKLSEAEREIWQRRGRIEGQAKGIAEGRVEGRVEGKTEGIIQVVKEMLKNKEDDKKIIQYTHISEKELEELKLQMA